VLCTTVVHNDTHTRLSSVGLGLGSGLVFVRLSRFSILCVFWFSLDYFVLVLFACVVLGLVSSVLRQEIGWEERLRNNLFFVSNAESQTLTESTKHA